MADDKQQRRVGERGAGAGVGLMVASAVGACSDTRARSLGATGAASRALGLLSRPRTLRAPCNVCAADEPPICGCPAPAAQALVHKRTCFASSLLSQLGHSVRRSRCRERESTGVRKRRIRSPTRPPGRLMGKCRVARWHKNNIPTNWYQQWQQQQRRTRIPMPKLTCCWHPARARADCPFAWPRYCRPAARDSARESARRSRLARQLSLCAGEGCACIPLRAALGCVVAGACCRVGGK